MNGAQPGSRVWIPLLSALLLATATVWAVSTEPPTPRPEPTLTLAKDTGTGDVVLSWIATTGPYAVVRSTSADFFGLVAPQVLTAGLSGTTFRDPVLTDGIAYYYSIEDANAPPKVHSLSINAGLPGDSVTLTGTGFAATLGDYQVFVTGVPATVTAVTSTTLTFTVPAGVVTGSVVVLTPNGADAGRLLYVVAAGSPSAFVTPLENISTVAVDAAHIPFVADRGTTATADKVHKFDPATGSLTQVGAIAEPIGLATDSATPNHVYYGSSVADINNFGTIRRTDSSGTDSVFGFCGDSTAMPVENCWVWAVGVDPDLTDFGAQGRVYVADRNHNTIKIAKPVGSPGLPYVVFAPSPGLFLAAPRGIVVDRNAASPFFHDVFVSRSATVERYSSAIPAVLEKTYDSTNSPILNPGQMAITPSAAASASGERLLIADRNQNRIVMINPATDKTKTIGIPLSSPRGIAVDQDVNGKNFAYVAEQARVLKFPIYRTVFVVPWIADGANISATQVRRQVEAASRSLEPCGIEVKIRDDKVNTFTPGALLDLEITDWSVPTNVCGGATLTRTGEEATLLDDTSRRSVVTSDVNLYYVRAFTVGATTPNVAAETITADCFTAAGVSDSANSGIIVSMNSVRKFSADTIYVIGHELGHALIGRLQWTSLDEHKNQAGMTYATPNIMTPILSASRWVFGDTDQCLNINADNNIFRGDP
jgi:hypothetical protein